MFLTPTLIIKGYKKGIFPMSNSYNDPYIFWVDPKKRGIIKINNFRISKSLKKFIKNENFSISINKNFKEVINNCRKSTNKRKTTWINQQILDNFYQLYLEGFAFSVEYMENKELLGGLYGVKVGKIFFGESMFSLRSNASKVALVFLAAHLKQGGFKIIDTQFLTNHLSQFGAEEIDKNLYLNLINEDIEKDTKFPIYLENNILNYF